MDEKIAEFKGEYRFLSNFWPAMVELDGVVYPIVEHAYQAAKTLDSVECEEIRKCDTPGKAKHKGKNVTLRNDWKEVRVAVMANLVTQKFGKYSSLKEKLLATGDTVLEEGNWWNDTFWGADKKMGRGVNVLGEILMEIRKQLREKKDV